MNFVTLDFRFSDDWTGYQRVVRLAQDDQALNLVLDADNKTMLPGEIHAGWLYVSVYGYKENEPEKATSKPLRVYVDACANLEDGLDPVPPTPDLYSQLLYRIAEAETKFDQMMGMVALAEGVPYGEPAYAQASVENGVLTLRIGVPGGRPGDRITDISVDEQNRITITLLDGTTYLAGSLEAQVIRVQDILDLPSVGRFNAIYIVSNTRKAYTFNDEPFGYVAIGDVDTMTILNGGDANG